MTVQWQLTSNEGSCTRHDCNDVVCSNSIDLCNLCCAGGEGVGMTIPILQMKKLRLREVKLLAQDPVFNEW